MAREEIKGELKRSFYSTDVRLFKIESVLSEAKVSNPGDILWQDKMYTATKPGKNAVALLSFAAIKPEVFVQMPGLHTLPTGGRIAILDWTDGWGTGELNFKGTFSVSRSDMPEATDHLNWEIHKRRSKWNDMAGREDNEQADRDVSSFVYIASRNPELQYDCNASIWRPIAVVAGKGLLISKNWTQKDHEEFSINQSVAVLRRFLFTSNRLDEYVTHITISPQSINALDRLRRKWGYESLESVFLRAGYRLGKASRYLKNAGVFHGQTINIVGYYAGSAGWVNFNNIAIDGSTGDLDCTRKATSNDDHELQMIEAFGMAIMYLTFIQSINPELIDSNQFLSKFFDAWKKGLGLEYSLMINKHYNSDSYFGPGDVLSITTEALERIARWYDSEIDTHPDHSCLVPSAYLKNSTKSVWVPRIMKVIQKLRQIKPI